MNAKVRGVIIKHLISIGIDINSKKFLKSIVGFTIFLNICCWLPSCRSNAFVAAHVLVELEVGVTVVGEESRLESAAAGPSLTV